MAKSNLIPVRHEEYGVLAAVAEAYLTGNPVAVCGTPGPSVVHLFNGLMDARKEGAPIIAICRGCGVEHHRHIHTRGTEPVQVFRGGFSLYRAVRMIDEAKTVAIFGGDGCREGRDEVVELACKLKAPVGYSFRGKQWLEHENPNAVGMTGLLGYGGAYKAIHEAELLLLLGTDFPFSKFLLGASVKKVQIDKNPKHIGRRTSLDLGLVGDVKSTVSALLQAVCEKTDGHFSREAD